MSELNLLQFVAKLSAMIEEAEESKHAAMEKACKLVENEAKSAIGTPKYGWTPLAPSTLAKKAADTPLLETGEMRDSIEHRVEEHHGITIGLIGTDLDRAVYQELGTSKIPPRSFLMEGAMHVEKEVIEILSAGAVMPLLTGRGTV